jgi:hypothetical protein
MPALPALAAFQPNPPALAGFLLTSQDVVSKPLHWDCQKSICFSSDFYTTTFTSLEDLKNGINHFLGIINHISVGHYEQISD